MYSGFAYAYDALQNGFDHEKWLDFAVSRFVPLNSPRELILDLGCGTGLLTRRLADRGYSCFGADNSVEMLDVASRKCPDISFIHQDITNLDLYGTVDAMFACCDVVNYVITEKQLSRMFGRIANFLNPGGLFIFDISTEFKLETVLANNTFISETKDIFCCWENSYNKRQRLHKITLNIFMKENGVYQRFSERHTQRGHHLDELLRANDNSGLTFIDTCDADTLGAPLPDSLRCFYVFQKC